VPERGASVNVRVLTAAGAITVSGPGDVIVVNKNGGAAHGGAHSGRLPSAYQEPTPNVNSGFAGGGRPSHTKIIAASGEYLVPPAKVAALGGGDMDKGHKIIDAFIMKVRNKTKKELRKLKPPKK